MFRLWEFQLNSAHAGLAFEDPDLRRVGLNALSAEQKLQRGLLVSRKWHDGKATTKSLREGLRADFRKLGFQKQASAIVDTARALIKLGLLEESAAAAPPIDDEVAQDAGDEPKAKRARKGGGWPMLTLKKPSWQQLDEAARKNASELQVGPDTFGA